MKSNYTGIRNIIFLIGFKPQEGRKDIYYKVYSEHDNYIIKVDFQNQRIEYGDKIHLGDLTTSNFENSENFIVLECINRILEKGYPPQNVFLEYKWPMGRKEKGKLDILITDEDDKAYLMIECKTWGQEYNKEKRKMQRDGGQLFSYYQQDKATQYLCLYTSRLVNNKIEYINDIIEVDKKWRELDNQKEIFDHWNKNFKDNGIFDEWADPYNIEMKALTRGRLQELTEDDSGKIFNQFAEILRHNIVSDKPNAFNKMLNLFICKIIDEDKNDYEELDFQWLENDTYESLQIRLNDLYREGMKRFLDIEVTDYSNDELEDKLYNINEPEIKEQIQEMFKEMRLQKNPEFAFKEVYNEESFKDNAIVVKEVVELLQPYQFRYGHKQQFLGDFFELLLNTSIKQESGQFFTPIPIAKFIVSSLPIRELIIKNIEENSADILPYTIDYATGSGHFLTEWMDMIQSIIDELETDKLRPSARKIIKGWQENPFQWAKDYVYGIEADYRLVKTAKVSSFLNGDGEATIIRANGLDSFKYSTDFKGKLKEFNQGNSRLNEQFDVVIANPPYSVNAFRNTLGYGEESFILYNRLTDESSEIECLFIERTMQLLKEGGLAGIVLPSSILTNPGIYVDTREIILKYFNVVAITELGANTFMATGTNTVILFLERRSNNEWRRIEQGIKDFFDSPKESTINGIEKAFSKYVEEIYTGITLQDYMTLINKKPNSHIKSQIFYKEYLNWFNDLTEIKQLKDRKTFKDKPKEEQEGELENLFYNKIFSLEQDKMLYFFLVYKQQTVLVKVGEKQAEKDFLGYEFSNRRGHEGIRLFRDENDQLTTKLYDEENILNPRKANYYIYKAFLGEVDDVHESMSENIEAVSLKDCLKFNAIENLKIINLAPKKKPEISFKWQLVKLGKLIKITRGVTYSKKDQELKSTNNKILTADNITLDGNFELNKTIYLKDDIKLDKEKLLGKDDIFICLSSGSRKHVGKMAFIDSDIEYFAGGFMGIIRTVRGDVLPKYLYELLNCFIFRDLIKNQARGSNINNLSNSMLDVQIPLPPINIQKKIINECIDIDNNYEDAIKQIKGIREEINNKVEQIYANKFDLEQLSKLAIVNPSKREIKHIDDDTMVSFIEMASVNEKGYIENKEDRLLGGLRKGSYTYFKENDIIIAKITPSMENGKCALASGLTNGLGMGSSEFHVIRVFNDIVINEPELFTTNFY